ncbi:hypothetical protein BLAT2472_110165 [Burkholderia latens]
MRWSGRPVIWGNRLFSGRSISRFECGYARPVGGRHVLLRLGDAVAPDEPIHSVPIRLRGDCPQRSQPRRLLNRSPCELHSIRSDSECQYPQRLCRFGAQDLDSFGLGLSIGSRQPSVDANDELHNVSVRFLSGISARPDLANDAYGATSLPQALHR